MCSVRMLRILIIGLGNPPPYFIFRRLELLDSKGIKLIVVAQENQALDNFQNAEIIRIPKKIYTLNGVKAILGSLSNLHYFFKLFGLKRNYNFIKRLTWSLKYISILRIKNPDLIHIQWIGSVAEFIWLRRFYSCPIIASARGSQVTIYPVTRYGYMGLIKEAIKNLDYIHCVSKDIEKTCLELGANKEQTIVNYNGINLQQFHPTGFHPENTVFSMISVGVFMWRKCYLHQLQILQKTLAKGFKVRLIWVGYGPDREGLEFISRKMGIQQFVYFAGESEIYDVPLWLRKSHAYISTSISEGLSNSVVEAASSGLPILAFSCEGMNEVIVNGVNGFIVPFGDINGMVEKVIYLAAHPEERIKMGIASRRIAEERFDEHVCVQQMIENYKSIAGKK